MFLVFTMNLGTTSSKLALFRDDVMLNKITMDHPDDDLKANNTMRQQLEYRKRKIMEWIEEAGVRISELSAIAVRVAILPRPVGGGTYELKGLLEEDLMKKFIPDKPLPHGSHITLPIAKALAEGYDIPFYLTDPASINDLIPEAKLSGLPEIERDTVFHALNQKMIARQEAAKMGKKYEECNFVIAHMGGGISVGVHEKGLVIDVNNCNGEEGAFSPQRAGSLPVRQLISLCYSGKYSEKEALDLVKLHAGVEGYLGTSDMVEVEKRIAQGDEKADLIFRTMAYQTSKEIGAGVAALSGKVDRILLTGGIAKSKRMVELISERVGCFAPVNVYPGEMESEALAAGTLRVLRGEEKPAIYPKEA